MVYLPVSIETTSLRGLAFEVLFWPRNGVGLRTVPELSIEAIASLSVYLGFVQLIFFQMKNERKGN